MLINNNKGEQDKTVERNFRPVNVLSAFSKIYEQVIKNQLIPHLDKSFPMFIAAYRERYSTQHVLIRLIEEWRLRLDNDYVVGAIQGAPKAREGKRTVTCVNELRCAYDRGCAPVAKFSAWKE